ncbi:MAG: metallophosphoesterase [Reichenbachiella sp.]|uniref:metallophosphoesterase n=1 Tax=Reichenbachiella sp. TaxID=2184521 RepID=UPI003266F75B
MKIQYASDLHLEFPEQRAAINSKRLRPVGDILILAGDICYLTEDHFKFTFFDYCSDHWKETYIVPGNHEFYNNSYDIKNAVSDFSISLRDNVQYLNNIEVEIENIRFLFSTLWTNVNKNPLGIEQGLNDFHQCTYEGKRFTVADHNQCHLKSLNFLNSQLVEETDCDHTVVVSHHVPFPESYCDYPFVSTLDDAFHSDLTPMLVRHKIDAWIYGHNHFNQPEFQIENTRMLTNQMGYVSQQENRLFNRKAVLDLT